MARSWSLSSSPSALSSSQTKLALGLLAATLGAAMLYYALRSSEGERAAVKGLKDDGGEEELDENTVRTSNRSADGDGDVVVDKGAETAKKSVDDAPETPQWSNRSPRSAADAVPMPALSSEEAKKKEERAAAAAAESHSRIESIDKRGKALFKAKKYMEAASAWPAWSFLDPQLFTKEVLCFLDPQEIGRAAAVCSAWDAVVRSSDAAWEAVLRRAFGPVADWSAVLGADVVAAEASSSEGTRLIHRDIVKLLSEHVEALRRYPRLNSADDGGGCGVDATAARFVFGMRHGFIPNEFGDFSNQAEMATPIHYRFRADERRWEWSPDGTHWCPTTTTAVPQHLFPGAGLAEESQKIVQMLQFDPSPPLFRRHLSLRAAEAGAATTAAFFRPGGFNADQLELVRLQFQRLALPCLRRKVSTVHLGLSPPLCAGFASEVRNGPYPVRTIRISPESRLACSTSRAALRDISALEGTLEELAECGTVDFYFGTHQGLRTEFGLDP